MLRVFVILLMGLAPATAHALCEGRDVIKDLPTETRALIETRAKAMPFGEGLYWQAKRDNTIITIFGTYHFRHAQTEAHLDLVKSEVARADLVYLEMSNAEQKNFENTIAADPSIMFITEGPTLPDLLGAEDWDKFRAQMQARGFPGIMASKLKPIWAALMLGMGPCEALNGAMEANGIDAMIGEYAEAQGTVTRSLEDFRHILRILDGEPLEKQVEMIRLSLNLPLNADDVSYTIRERYLAEEIALTWQMSRQMSLDYGGPTAEEDLAKLEQVMLIDRNREWASLLAGLTESDRIFVAFGAGHLPGEDGVLRLLAERGFEIKRIPLSD